MTQVPAQPHSIHEFLAQHRSRVAAAYRSHRLPRLRCELWHELAASAAEGESRALEGHFASAFEHETRRAAQCAEVGGIGRLVAWSLTLLLLVLVLVLQTGGQAALDVANPFFLN